MAESKIKAEYLLSRINDMFKVVDISNPIKCANNEKDAIQIHKTKNYDRVPIKDGNENIEKYYDSNENKTVPITPANLISESSGILETLSYLSKKRFYFVLTGNKITRIVHYSDLNSPLVSLEIYSQIAYCEKAIRDYAISNNMNETDEYRIKQVLTDINENLTGKKNICIQQAEGRFNNKQTDDIETNLLDELNFDDELILFRELSSRRDEDQAMKSIDMKLDDNTIESYKNLRNDIMHSKPIIKGKNDKINELIEFLKTCQEITLYIEMRLSDKT
jgi:hypothetical protein